MLEAAFYTTQGAASKGKICYAGGMTRFICLALALLACAPALAEQRGGGVTCELPKPVEISVAPRADKLVYDHSRSMAELQAVETDTISPYGFDGVSITQGFTEGAIGVRSTVTLDAYPVAQGRGACVFYDSIDVEFSITPKITIAREAWRDHCMRKAVVDHELKHVMTDRRIVNKYGRVMGEKLHAALAERGLITGPVRAQDVPAVAEQMRAVAYQILEHEQKRMELERADAQQAVDSRQEYDRVAALCPDFETPDEAIRRAR